MATIKVGLGAGNLVRLTRTGPDRAEGMFDAGQAAFMELRHTPGASGRIPYTRLPEDAPVTQHTTTVDPRLPWTCPVVWFLTALRIGPHYCLGYSGNDPQHAPTAVCLSTPDGSRREVTLAPEADGSHLVNETGPTRLWAQVEQVYQQWNERGQPHWPRLGLTVTTDTQTIFLDEPGNTLTALAGHALMPGG